jgi:hypothetical protein
MLTRKPDIGFRTSPQLERGPFCGIAACRSLPQPLTAFEVATVRLSSTGNRGPFMLPIEFIPYIANDERLRLLTSSVNQHHCVLNYPEMSPSAEPIATMQEQPPANGCAHESAFKPLLATKSILQDVSLGGPKSYLDPLYTINEKPIGSRRPIRVVCLGAGYSGLMMSIMFNEKMQDRNADLVIYERNSDLGGTWLENRFVHETKI